MQITEIYNDKFWGRGLKVYFLYHIAYPTLENTFELQTIKQNKIKQNQDILLISFVLLFMSPF